MVLSLVVAACLGAPCARAETTRARPYVSVVAMASLRGAKPAMLIDARVRVYDVGGRRRIRGRWTSPPRLVGRGRTGTQGVAFVELHGPRMPTRVLVTASGGHMHGTPFDGTLKSVVTPSPHRRSSIWLNPASTVLAEHALSRSPRHAAGARERVRRFLTLPPSYDFGIDFVSPASFDGRLFLDRADAEGGFDRYVRRLVRRMARGGEPVSFAAPSTDMPTPAVRPAGAGIVSVIVKVAQLGAALIITGQKIYQWVTEAQTNTELVELVDALTTIEDDLNTVIAEDGTLTAQIASLDQTVNLADYTTAADQGTTLITNDLKPAAQDLYYLMLYGNQVCDAAGPACAGKSTMMDLCGATAPYAYSGCAPYFTYLAYWTGPDGNMYEIASRHVVQDYAQIGGGGVVPGGTLDAPGTIQYAAQAGADTASKFYQPADAELAQAVWGQYVGWTMLGQLMTEMWWGSLLGQPNPLSPTAPPVDATILQNEVTALAPYVDGIVQCQPQMPDGLVVDTTTNLMWPQTIGGLTDYATYAGALDDTFTLGPSAITSSTGAFITANATDDAAVPTLTTLLPLSGHAGIAFESGEIVSVPPQVRTLAFSDWQLPQETQLAGLFGGVQGWASVSTQVNTLDPGTPGQARFSLSNEGTPDVGSGYTAAYWLSATSGIAFQLFAGNADGQGLFVYVNEQYFWIQPCAPAEDGYCLLPTWTAGQSASTTDPNDTTPYVSPNGQTNLFDLNNALDVTNQTGHPTMNGPNGQSCGYNATDDSQNWWNNADNWSATGSVPSHQWPCGVTDPSGDGDTVPSLSDSLNGVTGVDGIDGWNTTPFAALPATGRPVLFYRTPATTICTAYYAPSQTQCTAAAPSVD